MRSFVFQIAMIHEGNFKETNGYDIFLFRGWPKVNESRFPKGPVVRGLDPDFFIPLFKSLFAIISLFFLEHPIIWTKELY